MGQALDFNYKVRKFYKFTPNEIKGLLIAILVLAFIISFRRWGGDTFDPVQGFFNLFLSILIVALSLLINDAGKRLWGLMIGYRIEFKMWGYGLLVALILTAIFSSLFDKGFWLLIPGGFMIHHLAGHRLGWFRYGINYFGQAMVAFGGALFTLTLIVILKILNSTFPSEVFEIMIRFNVLFLITSMLPIPPLDGSKIYWGSRMTYMFVMPTVVAVSILMMLKIPVFLSIVLSLLIAVILWIVYYISFENKVWTGPK